MIRRPPRSTRTRLLLPAVLRSYLWQRCRRGEANMMFNRYLDHSPEDEGAVGLMALFMSVRACIRAHVSAARAKRGGDDGDAKAAAHYLAVAGQLIAEEAPRLIAIGGLSGTGKSTLARTLGDAVGRSEEHTSELQSLMRISYAVFCLKKQNNTQTNRTNT